MKTRIQETIRRSRGSSVELLEEEEEDSQDQSSWLS